MTTDQFPPAQASDEPMRAAMEANINDRTQALANRLAGLGISNLAYTVGPNATRGKLINEINRVLDRFEKDATKGAKP